MAKTMAVELMMGSNGCGEGHGDDEVTRDDGDGNDDGDCDINLHCPLGWTESPGRHIPKSVCEHVSRGDEGIHALDVGITVSWAMCHIEEKGRSQSSIHICLCFLPHLPRCEGVATLSCFHPSLS